MTHWRAILQATSHALGWLAVLLATAAGSALVAWLGYMLGGWR